MGDNLVSQCGTRRSICLNLKKAARATSLVLDEYLSPLGIKASQLGVLNEISLLGTATMSELAEASVSDRTTLTRNLGPLERDGYVEVIVGRDRRVRQVQLTVRGEALLAKALPLRQLAEKKIIEHFGATEWDSLLDQLTRLMHVPRI